MTSGIIKVYDYFETKYCIDLKYYNMIVCRRWRESGWLAACGFADQSVLLELDSQQVRARRPTVRRGRSTPAARAVH